MPTPAATDRQGPARHPRRPGDLAFAAGFLALSVLLLSQVGSQTAWLKGTQWFAQPRLWPAIALVGMALLAGLHLAGSLASPRLPGTRKEIALWLRSLEYVPYFLAYVVVVPLAGYMPSTILFSTLLALRVGRRGTRALLLMAAFGFCVAAVFRGFLQVKLPAGRVYELLPDALRSFALIHL